MGTTPQPFTIGQNLTHHELQQAFHRIAGRPLPAGCDLRLIAGELSRTRPRRFEFEVNRCRGLAFDLEELRGAGGPGSRGDGG